MPPRRAVLLCGSHRTLVAAVARELSAAGVRLVIQAARADRAATQRLCRTVPDAALIPGDLAGEAAIRRVVAAAWQAARGIDTVIVCPTLAPSGAREVPEAAVWDAAMHAGLRAPALLAKELGRRWRRSGGRIIFAVDGDRNDSALAHVIRSGLLVIVEALSRALPPAVAVAAVVAGARPDAAGVARGVGQLVIDAPPPTGTVLALGARKG